MAKKLRPGIAKEAKERQREHGKTAPGKKKNTCGKLPQVNEAKTRTLIAKAVGTSGRTLDKIAAVVESGDEKLIATMNRTSIIIM